MKRLRKAWEHVYESLAAHPAQRTAGLAHLSAVSELAMLLALRRGQDVELAGVAGMLHDLATYVSGDPEAHAQRSAALARKWMEGSGDFTKAEQEQVLGAIYYHSDKELRHLPFDETLKDADVAAFVLENPGCVTRRARTRWEALKAELNL